MSTLLEVMDTIRDDMDLDEDELVSDTDLANMIHRGVKKMAAHMAKLGVEDRYYLAKTTLSLVAGQEAYSFPSDIFGQKVYALIYNVGRDTYTIKRVRSRSNLDAFEQYHLENQQASSNPQFRYMILNQSLSAGPKILLVPTAPNTVANAVVVWYVREPAKATTNSAVIDVPDEFIEYVIAFGKYEAAKKDVGHPLTQVYKQELDDMLSIMIETLTDQTDDGDNEIPMDLSSYDEQVGG